MHGKWKPFPHEFIHRTRNNIGEYELWSPACIEKNINILCDFFFRITFPNASGLELFSIVDSIFVLFISLTRPHRLHH